MKKLLTILLILSAGLLKAQTVVPATLTVDSLNKLPNATYRFYTIAKKDTVDMSKNTIPACPKQRTVIRYRYSSATRKTTFTYDDGTTSTL